MALSIVALSAFYFPSFSRGRILRAWGNREDKVALQRSTVVEIRLGAVCNMFIGIIRPFLCGMQIWEMDGKDKISMLVCIHI